MAVIPDQTDPLAHSFNALRSSPVAEEARAFANRGFARRQARAAAWRRVASGWPVGVGVGACVLLALVLWQPETEAQWETVATRTGQRATLTLADGSHLALDTATRLYVRLAKDRRELRLASGRATFDVAHDKARPFTVTAPGMTVTAIGTRFSMSALPRQTGVVLVRGRVRVVAAHGRAMLIPGQGTMLTTGYGLSKPHPVDVTSALAWETGSLNFNEVTVADALEEANRYTRAKIVVADNRIGQQRIGGVFRAGDTHALVAALCAYFELHISARSADRILLSAGARENAFQSAASNGP